MLDAMGWISAQCVWSGGCEFESTGKCSVFGV